MFLREFINLEEKPGCNMTESGRACAVHGLMECPGYKMIETSAQEKLHQRHQEIRKKSGLPNPNYYKELRATFDLPDEERHRAVTALKKKYKIKEQAPTGHGQISTKYGADGTKVSFDPATGGKTVSGATGTTSYNVAGQKTAYQTPTIGGISRTTNYQTGEKTTAGQVGDLSVSSTQRPDQSTVTTAQAPLGSGVTASVSQGIGFGGAGKNVQQGGNQVSTISTPQGTQSFTGKPTQQDVEKTIPQQPVDEAGPFSYGAKKPRKGSVADLAAKKRQEQERGKQPIEPRDQRVGTAKVVKELDVRGVSAGDQAAYDQYAQVRAKGDILDREASETPSPVSFAGSTQSGFNQDTRPHTKVHQSQLSKDLIAAQTTGLAVPNPEMEKRYTMNKLALKPTKTNAEIAAQLESQGVAEGTENLVAVVDGVRSNRTYNDKDHAHNSLSKLVGYGKAKVAELYVNGEKVEHFEIGKKYREFEPKSLDSTMSESSGVTKLNDYNTWSDQVDTLGAEKHMQKNRTLIVAQSWDGERVGEFDTRANQGWVMSQSVQEGRKPDYNFDIEDIKKLEQVRDLETLKTLALQLISKPSTKPMKPEKVEWFKSALERIDSPLKVIKLMYDLLLSGEGHSVIGSRKSMNPNTYRQRFGEEQVTNEDVEKYLEEMQRAGYEVITETAELCPECGGPAFADQLLAEKKDACYSKVKSRYKVWPSAYASGALVRCRKVGAKNWGNKSKK